MYKDNRDGEDWIAEEVLRFETPVGREPAILRIGAPKGEQPSVVVTELDGFGDRLVRRVSGESSVQALRLALDRASEDIRHRAELETATLFWSGGGNTVETLRFRAAIGMSISALHVERLGHLRASLLETKDLTVAISLLDSWLAEPWGGGALASPS